METGNANVTRIAPFRYYHVLGMIVGALAVATVWLLLAVEYEPARKIIVAPWLTLPPIWEFVEFHRVRKSNPTELQNLKDSQEKARYVWAGFAAMLGLIYLKP